MHTSTVLLSVLALAGSALADVGLAVGLGIAVNPATPTPEVALERRDIDTRCVSSVLSKIGPPSSAAPAFTSWASTAIQRNAPCTITAPASFASDYSSVISGIDQWLKTVEGEAAKIHTQCGADRFSITFSSYCRSSMTVLFTEDDQTSTALFAPLPVPTGPIFISGALRNTGVISTAVAFAAVLGVVIAL